MLFSVIDLLKIILIAAMFICMFRVQKAMSPHVYFSMSSLILEATVSVRKVIYRVFLLFAFGALISKVIETEILISIGTGVGAFLIIWPALLNPMSDVGEYYLLSKKDRTLYYFLLILFVFSSILIVTAGANISPFTFDIITDIIKDWIIILILGVVGKSAENIGGRYLDKKITLTYIQNSEEIDSPSEISNHEEIV